MVIGSRQRLSTQCDKVDIRIDDEMIRRVDHVKSLGPVGRQLVDCRPTVGRLSADSRPTVGEFDMFFTFTDTTAEYYLVFLRVCKFLCFKRLKRSLCAGIFELYIST